VAQLYRVILPVADIETAAQFYAAVLEEPGERVSGGRHYFAGDGGAVLACYEPLADGDQVGSGWRFHENQYVYFSVEDLAHVRRLAVKAGAHDITEIASMPWGETMFYALDPFGNPISFVKAGTEFTGARAGR
jgi:predicted enzyme related to lactoylglutathione lyase